MSNHKEDNKLSKATSKPKQAKTGNKVERLKVQNFVAKHAHTFNSFSVHVDKKKRDKKGYQKHKADY